MTFDTRGTSASGTREENTNRGAHHGAQQREDDDAPPPRVAPDVRVAVMQARAARGLTQKQLAQRMQCPLVVVQELEAGKRVVDNAFLARLEKELACRLPRQPRVQKTKAVV